MTSEQLAVLRCVYAYSVDVHTAGSGIRRRAISERLSRSTNAIGAHLLRLSTLGLVECTGRGPKATWRATEAGHEEIRRRDRWAR